MKKGKQEKTRKKNVFFQKSLAKIQNGCQALDMVRPTFFSMGDNSKILFSFIEFSYPGNSEQ